MEKKIILASSSPRRKDILKNMGLEFEIIPSDYEEVFETDDFAYEKIEELAYNKAKSVLEQNFSLLHLPSCFILGADTVVVLDEKIMGKPKDETEAVKMLKRLSGNKHSVVTSICVIDTATSQKRVLSTTSFVEFNILTDSVIRTYIKDFEPFDKAGSYGIQELPEGFIKNIEGSFENIIGLCPQAVEKLMREFL